MTPTAQLEPPGPPEIPPVRPRGLVPATSIGVTKHLAAARAMVALSAPVGVGVAYGVGWLVFHSYNIAHERELLAAAVLSGIAGVIAVLPMVALMARGAIALVHLTMIAMIVRMLVTLCGLILLFGPGWKLDHGVLVLCTAGCYFTLMMAESAATIWASRH